MFEISHSILFLCVYCRKQVCGVHCGFVGGRCEGILIYIQPAKANLCKAESPFWMNSVMLSFDLTILRNEYNVILTFFWHSRIEPREQEVWSVVRISIGQNSKQCEAMLTLAWLCESKCTASRGKGSPWRPLPLPDAPSLFFASAEISRLRLSRPSQRSQEPSLRSEKLIGIGFAESKRSEKLGARRIWERHKTFRAAVHLCVHCRKSLCSVENL